MHRLTALSALLALTACGPPFTDAPAERLALDEDAATSDAAPMADSASQSDHDASADAALAIDSSPDVDAAQDDAGDANDVDANPCAVTPNTGDPVNVCTQLGWIHYTCTQGASINDPGHECSPAASVSYMYGVTTTCCPQPEQ